MHVEQTLLLQYHICLGNSVSSAHSTHQIDQACSALADSECELVALQLSLPYLVVASGRVRRGRVGGGRVEGREGGGGGGGGCSKH